jgi:MATE family multidrug resistance protein
VAAIVLANLVNAALNWVLVFGHLGAPAMGAIGSAIATTVARCVMAVALILYVLSMRDRQRYAVRRRPDAWWRDGAQARSVGYAAGTSAALEASAFGSMTLFAGWFGAATLAAYAIAVNAWTVVFMSAIGLGIGTAVRVGHAAGAGDRNGMREAGWVGLGVVLAIMAIVSLAFVVFRMPLARVFTDDPALAREAAAMLAMCAWVILIDSGKTVMLQAVRGTGDTWVPTRAQFFLVFGVMVPSAYVLAFPLGLGPAGLFLGMLAAAAASLAFLVWRFWMRCA